MAMPHFDVGDINGPHLIWQENRLVSQQIGDNGFFKVAF